MEQKINKKKGEEQKDSEEQSGGKKLCLLYGMDKPRDQSILLSELREAQEIKHCLIILKCRV